MSFAPTILFQYIKESFYRAACHVVKRESSRQEPAQYMRLDPGTWKIDDEYSGPYGHLVEELRLLDPNDLIPGEVTVEERMKDVERYAGWMADGLLPPPISVVQTVGGHLRIYNGHRRWLAARMAGVKILAWVNPIAGTGRFGKDGRPEMVGLTYELANGIKRSAWRRFVDWFRHLLGG